MEGWAKSKDKVITTTMQETDNKSKESSAEGIED
jgi:hypothetical protein